MARVLVAALVAALLLLGSWDLRPRPVVLTGLDLAERNAGLHEFGPITLPEGATHLQVPVAQSVTADPDLRIDWGIETYRENERAWRGNGAAGTIGDALRQRASRFGVRVPVGTRLVRGWLRLSTPTSTALKLIPRGMPARTLFATPTWAAVSIPDITTAVTDNTSVTTLTTPTMTVTSNANRAGILGLSAGNQALTITSGVGSTDIGGVAASAITGTGSGFHTTIQTFLWGVVAPPSGAGVAGKMTWDLAADAVLGVMVTSGVNQGGVNAGTFNNGTTTFGSSASASTSITSTNGDLTVDVVGTSDGTMTTNQTSLWNDVNQQSNAVIGGAARGPGTGTATHTWTLTSSFWTISGANFVAAVGGATCPATLMMMGVGC